MQFTKFRGMTTKGSAQQLKVALPKTCPSEEKNASYSDFQDGLFAFS